MSHPHLLHLPLLPPCQPSNFARRCTPKPRPISSRSNSGRCKKSKQKWSASAPTAKEFEAEKIRRETHYDERQRERLQQDAAQRIREAHAAAEFEARRKALEAAEARVRAEAKAKADEEAAEQRRAADERRKAAEAYDAQRRAEEERHRAWHEAKRAQAERDAAEHRARAEAERARRAAASLPHACAAANERMRVDEAFYQSVKDCYEGTWDDLVKPWDAARPPSAAQFINRASFPWPASVTYTNPVTETSLLSVVLNADTIAAFVLHGLWSRDPRGHHYGELLDVKAARRRVMNVTRRFHPDKLARLESRVRV